MTNAYEMWEYSGGWFVRSSIGEQHWFRFKLEAITWGRTH